MRQVLAWVIVLWLYAPVGWALPRVPVADDEIIERLPFAATTPAMQHLTVLRATLAQSPRNLVVAAQLARAYVELGRTTGDPRYAGYAQSALAPWWSEARPPLEVMVLRATLRQRVHDFDGALADLDVVLASAPRHMQARLTRATVLGVQGRLGEAAQECARLEGGVPELVWRACADHVDGLTGRLQAGERRLRDSLARAGELDAGTRAWAWTALAEMAVRGDRRAAAEGCFRQALALDPDDAYALAAYADHLLDQDRPADVIRLLKSRQRLDPLLLRYALAAARLRAPDAPGLVAQLRARLDASRRRGDRVHLREEARFLLELAREPEAALAAAKDNWAVQKEPADARVLLEAASAAGDAATRLSVARWLERQRLEDAHLAKLLVAGNPIGPPVRINDR